MPTEIERKYLIKNDGWKAFADQGTSIRQGYLHASAGKTVRVRIKGDRGFLTIKGKSTGISRPEFEYPVPLSDAEAMMSLCERPLIEKTRYLVTEPHGKTWELDIFEGENQGLIMAEIELNSEDEVFTVPSWAGDDVSADNRYYNANLMKLPFGQW